MGCSCVVSEEGEPIYNYSSSFRKSAKPLKCGECYGEISPLKRYNLITGVCDGERLNHRVCMDCLSVIQHMFCGGSCAGTVWQDVEVNLEAIDCDMDLCCLENLTPRARTMYIDAIDEVLDGIK
jgi:hypothetical protein